MRHALAPLAALAALVFSGGAQAMGFAEAFEAARNFDAQYRAAGFERDAARQSLPIARSYMLPNVSINASSADVSGKRLFNNSLNQEVRVPVDYNSPQASLQIRTPIFNYEALMRTRVAAAQVDSAESGFEVKGLELVDRLGSAYLQVLLSVEAVFLSRAETQSLEGQLARARQRMQGGEGTRTDVAQTEAQLELSRVRLIEAQDQLAVSRRVVRRLTGQDPASLKGLPGDYLPAPVEPATLEAWQDLAERQNPGLRARRQNVDVTRLSIQRARANHLPRLDLVASLNHSQNESLSSLNQTSSTRSIGVQLSVPLYSGGGIEASVQQAVADQSRAEEDLRNERETVQLEIQRQHAAVRNGRVKVEGYVRAAQASEVTLQGVTRALAAGLATHADVLDAQTRLFSARRDVAQARYEYLSARLRLNVFAGVPAAETVADIDRQLTVVSSIDSSKAP